MKLRANSSAFLKWIVALGYNYFKNIIPLHCDLYNYIKTWLGHATFDVDRAFKPIKFSIFKKY